MRSINATSITLVSTGPRDARSVDQHRRHQNGKAVRAAIGDQLLVHLHLYIVNLVANHLLQGRSCSRGLPTCAWCFSCLGHRLLRWWMVLQPWLLHVRRIDGLAEAERILSDEVRDGLEIANARVDGTPSSSVPHELKPERPLRNRHDSQVLGHATPGPIIATSLVIPGRDGQIDDNVASMELVLPGIPMRSLRGQ